VSYGWNESTQDQPKKHRAPFFRLVSGERAGEYNPQHARSSGANGTPADFQAGGGESKNLHLLFGPFLNPKLYPLHLNHSKESTMKIGILGSGTVAQTLAAGFLKHGYEVAIGSRNPGKLAGWAAENPGAATATFEDAAKFGDLIVLAVKGTAAVQALALAGPDNLSGKTVIDTTNPIEDAPPVNGVLPFFTTMEQSLMEDLQRQFPDANFVKAFNSVGAPAMVNPQFKGGKPTMFICGNSDAARQQVTEILDQFGWETADMGKAEAARAIEPLCILWCIPGFLRNQWTHAFKLLQ
jgi:predicted dinucleotide-binding enzyme